MMTCIFGRGRTLPSCRLAAIGILVAFLVFCHGRVWALNQINNGTFLSDWSGWTIDNQVRRGFPLESFSWVAT